MFAKSHLSRRQRTRASALVFILLALVVVSTLVVLFISQATLNRQIAFSSAGQFRAESIARTGLDTIIGDLRSEMAAGSVITTNSPTNLIYTPLTNFTIVASRVGDNGYTNVVKRSAGGSNFWTNNWSVNPYLGTVANPRRSATNNSTATASANGRAIKATRWNAPYLMGSNFPTGFVPPDWIMVTRSGPVFDASTVTVSQMTNSAVSNLTYAIGRFSYVIYNEGGLLDVNVAGYPTSIISTNSPFVARRGLLPQVDLSAIPGVLNANQFVQWRNANTAISEGAYTNMVLSATNGFASAANGDQSLVSRQDLIKYVKNFPTVISTNALQYLGTFSRELNAPTFTPPAGRKKVGPLDDTFNPSLINTPVSIGFTRLDGTTATIGEPLLKNRFPLSRLALLANAPNVVDESSAIYRYFGLTRQNGQPWVYDHNNSTTPGRILNLSEVAAKGREPDFFELLQAGILYGSLGKTGYTLQADTTAFDSKQQYQIIQIGANIIDQYDENSFPTRISFDNNVFDGIENLPYLYSVFYAAYRPLPSPRDILKMWFVPEVWNPHALPSTAFNPSSLGPSRFRFIVKGTARGVLMGPGSNSPGAVVKVTSDRVFPDNPPAASGIEFSISSVNKFDPPSPLNASTGAIVQNIDDQVPDGKGLGVYIGQLNQNDPNCESTDTNVSGAYPWTAIETPSPLTFELQYQNPNGGDWITYSKMKGVVQNNAPTNTFNNSEDKDRNKGFTDFIPAVSVTRIGGDPRSDRFSAVMGYEAPYNGLSTTRQTFRPDAGPGKVFNMGGTAPAGWFGQGSISIGLLSENLPSSYHYEDPDGETRKADGAYRNGLVPQGGYPLATDSTYLSRPVILNRPFRSVGDLGYAFRDLPWKTLDLFTAESADSALLDLFCLNESPQDAVVAGRVDLNTRQQPVLEAILNGAVVSEKDGTQITFGSSSGQAKTLATSLLNLTTGANGPLLNRSDLVNRWIGSIANSAYGNAQDTFVKRRREAAVRALADVGTTRSWNLLIDIVAQSGRFAPNATGINQFLVEGEKRYWLHLALDRYTGKVIAQYLEPVTE